MKRLLIAGAVLTLAVAAIPPARRFMVNSANEFMQIYRERERAITAAVLDGLANS